MEFGKNVFGVGEWGAPSCMDADGDPCPGMCCGDEEIATIDGQTLKERGPICDHYSEVAMGCGHCLVFNMAQRYSNCEDYHCGLVGIERKRELIEYGMEKMNLQKDKGERALRRLDEHEVFFRNV